MAAAAALPPKTLILCFDGTNDQYDENNTNVVKLFSALRKDNPSEQMCYYQPGVGTYYKPGVISSLFQWGAKIMDEAVAWYLYEHVTDGYRFLMQNYRDGDKICLFGFSRGAYTARALAGLLHKIGLLPKDNDETLPFVYKLYKRTDTEGLHLAAGFKRTFCRNVMVEFVGVWDTVASVGVVFGQNLPFTSVNTTIKTFRHALSLDEHRVKFVPSMYTRPAPDSKAARLDPHHASDIAQQAIFCRGGGTGTCKRPPANLHTAREATAATTDSATTAAAAPAPPTKPAVDAVEGGTDVLEVWFSGVHTDVGGGAVADATPASLSGISLRWMIREILRADCGIALDADALERLEVPFSPKPAPGQDAADALTPTHDAMRSHPLWWVLELLPLSYTYQDGKGVWHRRWRFHLGKGRIIPDVPNGGPWFHDSVRMRMESIKYKPRATWRKGSERWYVE